MPSGALLALTATITAATAVLSGLPAGPAQAAADDQVRNQEWWLAAIHVTQAWQSSRGSAITVAVLSTGVDTAHPDLAGSVITGPDYTGSGRAAGSPYWGIEGTSAASVIAGHGDSAGDASGIIGIAPAAKILSLRVVLDATDPLNASPAIVGRLPDTIAEGIGYAAAHGAQVIDLPLDPASLASGGAASDSPQSAAGGSDAERAAVNYAISKGAVLVAPAGDDGASGDAANYPAAYPGVTAVGAMDQDFVRSPFSSRQSYVGLTAPGAGVTAADPPAGYRTMATTDAASAMVAGIAALIRSRYPALTASQVRQALAAGTVSRPAAGATGYGAGTVDALKAIQAAAVTAAPATAASRPPDASSGAQARGTAGGTAGRAAPKTGILGAAKALLRDAAIAAGLLIVVLVASLLGLHVRRRRRRPVTVPRADAERRTLLTAPPAQLAPPPARARHARPLGERGVPGGVPTTGTVTGPQAVAIRASAPGTAGPADWQSTTATRPQLAGSSGPPWEPAPMPASEPPPELGPPAPEPQFPRRSRFAALPDTDIPSADAGRQAVDGPAGHASEPEEQDRPLGRLGSGVSALPRLSGDDYPAITYRFAASPVPGQVGYDHSFYAASPTPDQGQAPYAARHASAASPPAASPPAASPPAASPPAASPVPGFHASAQDAPSPGPAEDVQPPAATEDVRSPGSAQDADGGMTASSNADHPDDARSGPGTGPLNAWNPTALTDPFPAVPPPPPREPGAPSREGRDALD
jgi:subtilisin family serine protease